MRKLRFDSFHQVMSRRRALCEGALGFGSVALVSLLADEGLIASEGSGGREPDGRRTLPARADHVIFLFMKGGPSQVDTFDYKPRLQKDHGKPLPFAKPRVQFAKTGTLLASPWKFRRHGASGLHVSELFPNVAGCVDDLCIINSLHGTNAAHGGAALKLHTGSDNFVRPSMGAWISYGLGTENRDLPAFVTVCPTLAHGGVNNWGAAFLPAEYQGTALGVASRPSSEAALRFTDNEVFPRSLQRLQLDLLGSINRDHLELGGPNLDLEARIESFELLDKR